VALLGGITLLAFLPVLGCDFVSFDDRDYVTENAHVLAGLTAGGWRWAWTTFHASNWHPLTWLSLMLDTQLFGNRPGGYHFTNLLLHVANTLLLFTLVRRLTGVVGGSALVAALFGVHPLHVESVAWISERKDVLSIFFGLLALLAYARYAEAPSAGRYVQVGVCMALSLLAKPMLVTLPALLLLLEYWPLRRWRPRPTAADSGGIPLRRLVLEKVPLLALSVASCVVTVRAQQHGMAFASLETASPQERVYNTLVSYVQYLRQTLLPIDLAAFYPRPPGGTSPALAGAAALLLVGVSALVWKAGRRFPYLPVGWFWYLGTLVPVIGLVQVGAQARADRYTYFPLVGIFLILAWGLGDVARRLHRVRLAQVLAAAVVAALMITSWGQAHVWHDSTTLWEQALKVTRDNHVAHNNLGIERMKSGDQAGARRHFDEALRIRPGYAHAHSGLGMVLMNSGKVAEAAAHFRAALASDDTLAPAHYNLGTALAALGEFEAAAAHFQAVLGRDPGNAGAHLHLARVLLRLGKAEEAVGHFLERTARKPGAASELAELGTAYQLSGDWGRAADCFRRAIDLEPAKAAYHRGLALSLARQGLAGEARVAAREAVRLDPGWPGLGLRQAWALATDSDDKRRWGPLAVLLAELAAQLGGRRDAQTLDTLAAAYAEVGRFPQAVDAARAALDQAALGNDARLTRAISERLRLYENKQPFRAAPR
jgi:tetratricopeptide (TPR) repeat protein